MSGAATLQANGYIPHKKSNIIPFSGKIKIDAKGNILRYNKDGSLKKTHCNRVPGESSEVYAFRTKEEIKAMLDVFDSHIETKREGTLQRQIACRDKLLFLIGINVGVRGSDLRMLKWSFFFDEDADGNKAFKDGYKIQPKKQRKQGKFITMYFNEAVKKAIENYVSDYPIEDIDAYLFPSRKGDGPICVASLWRIIKDAAKEAGIKQNIGSHSLRKSWGFWCWHNAKDKDKALVILQLCFNHSSTQTTARYIGVMDEEISDMYNSIDLGLEFI